MTSKINKMVLNQAAQRNIFRKIARVLKGRINNLLFAFEYLRKGDQLISWPSFKQWATTSFQTPLQHAYKQEIIRNLQIQTKHSVFVETGTYLGQMVNAQLSNFVKIYSIELGQDLYQKAKEKFRNSKQVEIFHGDSGKVLPQIIKDLDVPAIFWLDGHFSDGITAKGDLICPIYEELGAIFKRKINHVLVIDDERLFVGKDDYPQKADLFKFIRETVPQTKIRSRYDMIFVYLNW